MTAPSPAPSGLIGQAALRPVVEPPADTGPGHVQTLRNAVIATPKWKLRLRNVIMSLVSTFICHVQFSVIYFFIHLKLDFLTPFQTLNYKIYFFQNNPGGGPRVVVSTTAFHARV